MILRHSHSTIYVADQDRAKAFYSEKLGLEVRDDVTLGNFRWLTVAPKTQPDACMILFPIAAGTMMTEAQARALRELLEAGVLGGGVLETDDLDRDYEALRARGVKFLREPKQMPYGYEALFADDSGNFFSLTQRR
jgi:predicted enzyme related to lactoylglutathione lyase